ncbi:hypothetical protein GINT2_001093 [Glugoides intestinalis]
MATLQELTESIKITKLLKEGPVTSKEVKEKLSEIVVIINAYILTALSEISKDAQVSEEIIQKVFKTLDKDE